MSWVSSAFNGDDGFDLEDNSSKRFSSRGGIRTKQKRTPGARRQGHSMHGSLSQSRRGRGSYEDGRCMCYAYVQLRMSDTRVGTLQTIQFRMIHLIAAVKRFTPPIERTNRLNVDLTYSFHEMPSHR